ncbi:hypothetical protein [Bacillus bombysepticus]|uniref:hypothetical protein n=1 Tax=Bacillus bombysepticus TaxID=658666 RepID=UPI00301A0D1A
MDTYLTNSQNKRIHELTNERNKVMEKQEELTKKFQNNNKGISTTLLLLGLSALIIPLSLKLFIIIFVWSFGFAGILLYKRIVIKKQIDNSQQKVSQLLNCYGNNQ